MTALRSVANATPRAGMVAAAVAASVGAGAAASTLSVSSRFVLILLTFVVLASPIVYRLVKGQYDILEPIVPAVVVLGVMFVLRPIELIRYGVYRDAHRLFDISPTFVEAQIVALAGCAGLVAGYALPLGARLGARLRGLSDDLDERTAVALAVALIVVGFTGYSVFAVQAGHSPLVLLSGQLHIDSQKSTAYLYNAPYLCIPAALVLIRIGLTRRRRALAGAAILMVAFFIHSLAPSGQRLWLLLLIMSLVVYPMLRSGWRPSAWLIVLIAVPTMVMVIAMRDLNHGVGKSLPTEIVETIQYPDDGWREFITGADTEMFSMLALEMRVVPESLPYHRGNVIADVLTQPIPRQLFPGEKPASADGLLNEHVYGIRTKRGANMAGAAPSIIGVYFLEGGIVPVILGMALLGLIMRAMWAWMLAHRRNEMSLLLYASMLPLTVVALRGNPSDTLARGFFTVGPILLVAWLAQRTRRT